MPDLRGATVPPASTTWKLCIPWKLCTHIACFISAGCKVSTLTAARPRWPGRCPACSPQGHHTSHKLPALPSAGPKVSRVSPYAPTCRRFLLITARSACANLPGGHLRGLRGWRRPRITASGAKRLAWLAEPWWPPGTFRITARNARASLQRSVSVDNSKKRPREPAQRDASD
jgi:hypothetical protein